ncbi:alcohol dehydrogenase catalytic domain-containing protein [Streptomyces bobili]|uniref:alcohol dehydrogenase catalytic domain-containing protein n=1 Tax=Streptomyces bobili TaxID=67280 RepID=UPI00364688DD
MLRAPDGPFSVEPVTLRPLSPTQVLVKIAGTGLCHTDVRPREADIWADVGPAVLGHEGSGVIEAVGTSVTEVRPGDHVVISFASCGTCRTCRLGTPAYCLRFESLNLTGRDAEGVSHTHAVADGLPLADRWFGQSSFAEYSVVDQKNLVVVDPSLPLSLLGPLGCSMQTGAGSVFHEMDLVPGQSLAVFGAGAVGLAGVMAAKAHGAADIVVVDRDESRLEVALELGATRVIRGGDDVAAQVRGATSGVDYSLETTAVPALITASVEVLTRPGVAVLVGAGGLLTVAPRALAGRKVTFAFEGSAVPRVFVPQLIALWQRGLFPFERLVRTYPLAEINAAEADAAAGKTIKPVLVPS